MPTRYIYSTIRFVPDPARGEFVNVGIILGSDGTREWQLRTVENFRRAHHLDESNVLEFAIRYLNDISRRMHRYSKSLDGLFPIENTISEGWLRNLYLQSRNIIQFSPPAPVLAENIEAAAQMLFDELIVVPKPRTRPATKMRAHSAVKQAYKLAGLLEKDHIIENARIASPSYTGDFDFVVANGKALQLTQAWSFQISEDALIDKVKSWAWTVQDIRLNGGEVIRGGRNVEVPPDVEIDVVFVPPLKKTGVFTEARKAFEQVEVGLYEINGADGVAYRAERLLEEAHRGDGASLEPEIP